MLPFNISITIRHSPSSYLQQVVSCSHTHTVPGRPFSSSSSSHSPTPNRPTSSIKIKTTVIPSEIEKFSRISTEWWDPLGKFKPLHEINPIRVRYIRNRTLTLQGRSDSTFPLKGLKVVDVGCGGGLLSESLARLGASVTGIDASSSNIQIATNHLQNNLLHFQQEGALNSPVYHHTTAEELSESHREHFDVVCSLEVIEHVADVPTFVNSLSTLLKPGGLIFLSTINKTLLSYITTIVFAENILGWVPTGTHDWNKYIPPDLLRALLNKNGVIVNDLKGLHFNPLNPEKWLLNKHLHANYLLCGSKLVIDDGMDNSIKSAPISTT